MTDSISVKYCDPETCEQCNDQPGIRIEPDAKRWVITNGITQMPLCEMCAQPIQEGHVGCSCDKSHNPANCDRLTYDQLGEHLRRVAGDNADIAVKAMSQLTEAQEMLEVLLEAMVHGTDAIIANAAIKAEGLIETQKGVKLYE